ncbi:hypothetical protein SCHPADRAFT_842525 [Schizopora paradoxa]|uniref:GYF domain-containing protein n=1 Tax=Schizopora paradoxa TaxID=27342 RepID=A0A0H2S7J0_9AGAM|nr:hypothetical protein SCHPADRAFT_842525 [Schizopora paradoxa]
MATAMLFGPEWMRTKQTGPTTARPTAPSPPLPPNNNANGSSLSSAAFPGTSSYSSLVAPHPVSMQTKQDVSHPFKYSKDQMLAVWKEGGGGGPLPIDVERWEGVVREDAVDPATSREMSEAEKKLFAAPLNSEMRRRQSTDHTGLGDRPKLHSARSTQGGGSLADGLSLLGRRRRVDSTGTDSSPLMTLPRKSSWSTTPGNPASPGLSAPRSARPGVNGFEGVLSSSDGPWGLGKRRTSMNQLNIPKSDSESDATSDAVIKEEPESLDSDRGDFKDDAHTTDNSSPPAEANKATLADVNDVTAKVEEITLNTQEFGSGVPAVQSNGFPTNPPVSRVINLTQVNWTYLDPAGNIQGPFPAETMQTWHDQLYFTDDLRMKRVDIDHDWITVADIKTRAIGERVFLSHLKDPLPPPGLSRLGIGLPRAGIYRDVGHLDSPRQPTPQTFGTPHSVYAAGSASPASSFGVPAYNGMSSSPDSFAVGGRLGGQNLMGTELNMNGRLSSGSFASPGVNLVQHGLVHDTFGPIRHVGGEMQRSDPASYESNLNPLLNVPWQTPAAPINGWNTQLPSSSPFINHAQSQPNIGTPERFNGSAAAVPVLDSLVDHQPTPPRDPFGPSSDFSQPVQDPNTLSTLGQAELTNGMNAFAPAALQPLSMPIRTPSFSQNRTQTLVSSPIAPSPAVVARASPWGTTPSQETRISPFDAERPRASNTFVSGAKPAPVGQIPVRAKEEAPAPIQNVPWITGNLNNNWGQLSEEPQSLTTANVLKHEEQHKVSEVVVENSQMQDANKVVEAPAETAIVEVSTPAVATPKQQPDVPSQQPKRKQSSKPPVSPSAAKVETPQLPAQPKQATVVTPTTQAKLSPWVIAEDPSAKAAASVNLREIQEAEKKKQEARRQAELEKERAARAAAAAAAPASGEEVKYSASWGLPTSHIGTRVANSSTKEGATQPVWSNAVQSAAKKTMKEIQEEEERRRALAAKESVATAAKKSAAAAAASKVVSATPSSTISTGSAWSVVGSGGKVVNGVSTPSASRSNTLPSSAAGSAAGATGTATQARAAAIPASNRTATTPQISKPAAPPAKVVEEAPTPSAEFMKWLRESLKELNSSVQVEEITQMLLSFPLDPDPSTVELIIELIHGASTTLHGRRFASDFVAKRKEDASRPRAAGGSSGPSGKPASLAEVVRTQPKPAPEFSSFKVVKKKGKRS